MKKISSLAIFLFVSIVQNIIFFMHSINSQYFAIGLNYGAAETTNLIFLFILFAPLVIILFFFNGALEELTNGYGKLVIIRNYSKSKLLLKVLLKSLIETLFIVLIQTIESYLFGKQDVFFDLPFAKSLLVYFITLFSMVVLEMLLELSIDSHYAVLSVAVYAFVSYALKNVVSNSLIMKIIFFPSALFQQFQQTNIIDKDFLLSIGVLILVVLCLIMLTLIRFKHKDIY